jgi:hypothetical protein
MSNMSYCRFSNTASDMQDCIDEWNEGVSSKDEAIARKEMVELAERILELYQQDRGMVNNLELNAEGREMEDEDEDEDETEEEG